MKARLCKANKCLHVLRVRRKESYSQREIDYLFYSIFFPNITNVLSVYGASDAEIDVLQQFLDRCYKLSFISTQLNIRSLLQKQETVKPVLSRHRIKRTPSIKQTVAEAPKLNCLIYFK